MRLDAKGSSLHRRVNLATRCDYIVPRMPLLLNLPDEIVAFISEKLSLRDAAVLHGTCQQLWTVYQAKTCGVSFARLGRRVNTGDVYQHFGKEVRQHMATVRYQKVKNARIYEVADVVQTLHAAYGWKGLGALLAKPARREADLETRKRELLRKRVNLIDGYLSKSKSIPFDYFWDWIEDALANNMPSPAGLPSVYPFLTEFKRIPLSKARADLERFAEWQRRFSERKACLDVQLTRLNLVGCEQMDAYRNFCNRGEARDAASVARELARQRAAEV